MNDTILGKIAQLNTEAIGQFGKHQRIHKAIEELVELAAVLTKLNKIPSSCLTQKHSMFNEISPDLHSEIADVYIMLACLEQMLSLDKETINFYVDKKLMKFERYMQNAKTILR